MNESQIVSLDKELWRPMVGYESFAAVSNMGRVKMLERDIIDKNGHKRHFKEKMRAVKPSGTTDYPKVSLHFNGFIKTFDVHRLVAEAWIPNPEGYDCIDHVNECKSDNKVSNLRWCNHVQNNNFGTRNARISESLRITHKVKRIFREITNLNDHVDELRDGLLEIKYAA